MPIYEYQCQNCGEEFDMLRSIKENDRDVECPYCHEKAAERRISLTSAKDVFKTFGSSWGGGGCTRFG
jgi:putative FmdB family regulatory protein